MIPTRTLHALPRRAAAAQISPTPARPESRPDKASPAPGSALETTASVSAESTRDASKRPMRRSRWSIMPPYAARALRTPRAARASRCGVWTQAAPGFPELPSQSRRYWSLRRRKMFIDPFKHSGRFPAIGPGSSPASIPHSGSGRYRRRAVRGGRPARRRAGGRRWRSSKRGGARAGRF